MGEADADLGFAFAVIGFVVVLDPRAEDEAGIWREGGRTIEAKAKAKILAA
jgi:hypothetical protein